jgi:hypothetical protein
MSATILPFIRESVFSPEVVASMGDAFDRACAASAQLGHPSVVHEVIATRIIELAKSGERDPQVLCDNALAALGLPKAAASGALAAPETTPPISTKEMH